MEDCPTLHQFQSLVRGVTRGVGIGVAPMFHQYNKKKGTTQIIPYSHGHIVSHGVIGKGQAFIVKRFRLMFTGWNFVKLIPFKASAFRNDFSLVVLWE